MVAAGNIERIKAYGVRKIVTTCPHCFNTLARDYKDLGMDIDVEHYTTYINKLISTGRLLIKPSAFDFTYHDSCYLGRYMDITTEPRVVLKTAGGRITEMEKAGYESFCCGGGGGLILAEEKLGTRISAARVTMAQETGAPFLVSNCPFCLTMLEDGIKANNCEDKLKALDLAEIVASRLVTKE
jgi:Fe-S oxidoreductase